MAPMPIIATALERCFWILNRPGKCLARSHEPIMEPTADCERVGFFGNVVFTNGHVVDGDTLTLYYGASDSVICGASFSIREILSNSPRHCTMNKLLHEFSISTPIRATCGFCC